MIDERRLHNLNCCAITSGQVVYWMSREQRVAVARSAAGP